MPEHFGQRLVNEGVISATQLRHAQQRHKSEGIPWIVALIEEGASSARIADSYVEAGFGPKVRYQELLSADVAAVRRVRKLLAVRLVALPLRLDKQGLVVAMADPSSQADVRTISREANTPVIPLVAETRLLLDAIPFVYKNQKLDENPVQDIDDIQDVLIPSMPPGFFESKKQTLPPPGIPSNRSGDTKKIRFDSVAASAAQATTAPPVGFREPRWSDLAVRLSPESSLPPLRHDSSPGSAVHTQRPRRMSSLSRISGATEQSRSPKAPSVQPIIEAIRSQRGRDAIVRTACEGVRQYAHIAAFLALRRGVLEGRELLGDDVDSDAFRSLWIPSSSLSLFQKVVAQGEVYEGPVGTSTADAIFTASAACQGFRVIFVPIKVSNKTLGILCACGPKFQQETTHNVRLIAEVICRQFKRLIMHGKQMVGDE